MDRGKGKVTLTLTRLQQFRRFYVVHGVQTDRKNVFPLKDSILGRTVYKLVTIGIEGFKVCSFRS